MVNMFVPKSVKALRYYTCLRVVTVSRKLVTIILQSHDSLPSALYEFMKWRSEVDGITSCK